MTMPLAVAGIALLATLMAISSPTQALALGHWNLDEDFIPNSGIAEDVADGSGTDEHTDGEEEESTTAATTDEDDDEASEDGSDASHAAYDALQACLSDVEEVGSPTEQQVQDCMESSYREMDNSEEDSMENTSDDEDNTETTKDVSTDDTDDEEDEDSEE